MRRFLLAGALAVAAALVAVPAQAATLNATPGTFATAYSNAQAGDTIILSAGSYGTWSGGSKAVTVRPADGAAVVMGVNFTTGDQGLVLDGLHIPGGSITNGARDITIRNSAFTAPLVIDGVANANILLDRDTFNGINSCGTCAPARLHLSYGSDTPSGVTVRGSVFNGGSSDGIQSGVGLTVLDSEFANIREGSCSACHTDAIQLIGAKGSVVRGNYVHDSATGIVAYDGLDSAVIEDNVIDLRTGRWGMELYSDHGSVVRHNTLVYAPRDDSQRNGCAYAPCGYLILDHKSSDPAGAGTMVVDNIATTVDLNGGSSTMRRDHNMVRSGAMAGDVNGTPSYDGSPGFVGFRLSVLSAGKGQASDGLDIGLRAVAPAPAPTPTPSPTVAPTETPTPEPTVAPSPDPTPEQTPQPTPTYAPACAPDCDTVISDLRARVDRLEAIIAAALTALGG